MLVTFAQPWVFYQGNDRENHREGSYEQMLLVAEVSIPLHPG